MFSVIFRTFFLYILVVCCMRFMGKRQIGELQPSELVTTIIISNIAAIPIENMGSPLINGALPIILIACFEVVMSAVSIKCSKFRKFLSGSPIMIIRDGSIDQVALKNIRFSIDDLMEQLRSSGYFDLNEIAYAIVETNGKISVYPKFPSRPVTCKDLSIQEPGHCSLPVIIINDGIVDKQALEFCHVSVDWLKQTLKKESKNASDIFIMTCDTSQSYSIISREVTK